MATRLPFFSFVFFLFLLGCSSKTDPKSESDSGKEEENKGSPAPKKGRKEPATTKDGRWIISLTDESLYVKGSPVVRGKTSKTEIEKIIGPPDRVDDSLKGFHMVMLLWDKKGIRALINTGDQKVAYIECFFVVDTSKKDWPSTPFGGVVKIGGVEISKNTTKKMLQESGRFTDLISDEKDDPPYIRFSYRTHNVFFFLTKDRKNIKYIRLLYL